MTDLIDRRTRVAIRDLMNETVLREINEMWQDEGFSPPTEPLEPVGGQRVTLFQGYLDQVDWTHPAHVDRALRVFEVALRFLTSPGSHADLAWINDRRIRIRRLLARDSYELTDDGKISGGPDRRSPPIITPVLLTGVSDPDVIHDHLERISAAVNSDDPAQVIGSAKELVESTAKMVLRQLDLPVNDKDDLPALVRQTQEALAIHPQSAVPGADAAEGIRKILGGTITVTNGIAELRNRGYGTGHGPGQVRRGLSPRHARLAINAARTWCEFVLDTLGDPQAPWRARLSDPTSTHVENDSSSSTM